MSKIVLDVDDKNIDTVLIILNNLKVGLIKNISAPTNNINSRIQEKKLAKQQHILEDEFITSTPSTGKYLSRNAYKNKLRKG
ncbi:hypothetical protein KO488_11375 [Poseidonibacter lekithochrous]|uniref:hypothetical protein n=1 Tax=Poseidonibacter TaxID=2321187 RepID=UPI001C0A1E6F|nr:MULTISPECIES: hypothetical protein [Poseidonibacter]MBU3015361.1 hypothetical protein [Poseidonibacter lekithochrous]MDO6828660.1 hypothetical protein [Poseidonibacter sp. 1_MG-2023]